MIIRFHMERATVWAYDSQPVGSPRSTVGGRFVRLQRFPVGCNLFGKHRPLRLSWPLVAGWSS
jgi:hypothetical protein